MICFGFILRMRSYCSDIPNVVISEVQKLSSCSSDNVGEQKVGLTGEKLSGSFQTKDKLSGPVQDK